MPDPTVLRPTPPAPAATPAVPTVYKIELDERCLLFPDGKMIQHLLIARVPGGMIAFDAVFAFNRTHRDPRVMTLSLAEARDLARELVSAVYTARTNFVLNDTLKITINVIANGYHLECLREEKKTEVYFSTGVIWRVIKGLLTAVDDSSPVVAN